MAEYVIEVDDGLASVLEQQLPGEMDAEDWLALKCESAICESHLAVRRQELQQTEQ